MGAVPNPAEVIPNRMGAPSSSTSLPSLDPDITDSNSNTSYYVPLVSHVPPPLSPHPHLHPELVLPTRHESLSSVSSNPYDINIIFSTSSSVFVPNDEPIHPKFKSLTYLYNTSPPP